MIGNLGDILARMRAIAAKVKERDADLANELCTEIVLLEQAFMPGSSAPKKSGPASSP